MEESVLNQHKYSIFVHLSEHEIFKKNLSHDNALNRLKLDFYLDQTKLMEIQIFESNKKYRAYDYTVFIATEKLSNSDAEVL